MLANLCTSDFIIFTHSCLLGAAERGTDLARPLQLQQTKH